MNEEQSLTPSQKAQLATQVGELDQQIAQKDEQIRTSEQQLATAKAKQKPQIQAQLNLWQQERSSLLQQANTIRAQLGLPMVIPSNTPHPQYGAQVYPTAAPVKKRRGFLKTAAMIIIGLIILVAAIKALPGGNKTPTSSTTGTGSSTAPAAISGQTNGPAAAVAPPVDAGPPDEVAFVQKVESYYDQYGKADNELKKSALRADRKQAVSQLEASRTIKSWAGTLSSLKTTPDGKAYITIKFAGAKELSGGTNNNGLSDMGQDTLIAGGSPLYTKLSTMNIGAPVVFSGQFMPDTQDKDFLREISLTEQGSMTAPQYVMKFTDVTAK